MADLVGLYNRVVFDYLDLDAPERRFGYLPVGIVGDEILSSQLFANLPECAIKLSNTLGIVVFAAGIFRYLDERMLSANVAAGIGFDGNYDDAIDDSFRLLGAAKGAAVVGFAGRIASIGDQDKNAAAFMV